MGVLENKFNDNIVVGSLDKFLSWSRSTSPWFFQFGLACCAIEMMATAAARHDLERIGMMPRSLKRYSKVVCNSGPPRKRYPPENEAPPPSRNRYAPILCTAVYPARMAPFAVKLWEHAFQTIPDISFFDAQNMF